MTNRLRCFIDMAVEEGFTINYVENRSKHYLMLALSPDGRTLRQVLSKGGKSERSRLTNNFLATLRRFKRMSTDIYAVSQGENSWK
jgi:hypothetical protein